MAHEPRINATKTAAVEALKGGFSKGDDYIFASYRGLTVENVTNLRRKLRTVEGEFHIVKNNYARIAFQQLGKPDVAHLLVGPTAVAIAHKDGAAVAKALVELAKDLPLLEVKGGLVGKSVFNAKQTEAYSKLPGRNELLASLMGTMKAPVQNLVYATNGVTTKLVRVLQAVAEKKAAS